MQIGACKRCAKNFHIRNRGQIFCSLRCSNRFNKNNLNSVLLPTFNNQLAEFFGMLLGDGHVTQYFTRITLNRNADKDYVPYAYNLCKNLFPGAGITIWSHPKENIEQIQISSTMVTKYLHKIGFRKERKTIPSWIINSPTYTKLCIRGLVDTEGSVGIKYFHGKGGLYLYKQLTFTNLNPVILTFVTNNLRVLGYKATENSKKNIYISNRKDIEKYLIEIGSSNPKILQKLHIPEKDGYIWRGRIVD